MANKCIVMTISLMALSQVCLGKHLRFPRDAEPMEEPMETTTQPHQEIPTAVVSDNKNRLKNLIHLPLRLDFLTNILRETIQGIIDSKEGEEQSSIKGLFENVKIDELLRAVLEDDNIASQLLNGDLDDIVTDDTSADLLGILTQSNLRSGTATINGEELVNKLLNGVLDSVEQVIDNLLVLLENLAENLSKGLASNGLPQQDGAVICAPTKSDGTNSSAQVKSNNLSQALSRLNALINALKSLKKEIALSKQPCATPATETAENSD